MLPIRGVYEVAIRVRDLVRAEAFYREVLGLQVGIRDDARRRVFLRAGGQAGMIVLIEEPGDWPRQHLAFTVDAADIDAAADKTYDITGAAPHSHQVTFSAAQLAQLKAGTAVTVTSTAFAGDGHTHDATVSCVVM